MVQELLGRNYDNRLGLGIGFGLRSGSWLGDGFWVGLGKFLWLKK